MSLNLTLADFFRWVILGGMLLTCIRMFRCGLHRKYRTFAVFLLFSSVRSAVLLAVPVHSGAYMKVWVVTQPLNWIFYVLLVLELYSLVLQDHKGLYTLGRWAMYAALAAAVLLSGFSLFAPNDETQVSRLMPFLLLTDRGFRISLLIFLVLILGFLSRYPITLSRNVVIHSVVYSVFFLSTSVTFLLRSIFGVQVSGSTNTVLTGVMAACVVAWLVLLNQKGEERTVTMHPHLAGQEEYLVRQLDQINATVIRASHKH